MKAILITLAAFSLYTSFPARAEWRKPWSRGDGRAIVNPQGKIVRDRDGCRRGRSHDSCMRCCGRNGWSRSQCSEYCSHPR